jgi:hypothetical protein
MVKTRNLTSEIEYSHSGTYYTNERRAHSERLSQNTGPFVEIDTYVLCIFAGLPPAIRATDVDEEDRLWD